MVNTLYQGSVKNLLGPISFHDRSSIVFHYTDSYSVFDWGKMPDLIAGKGKALCTMGAYFFEKLNKPEAWIEFSKSKAALELRKGVVKISTDKIGVSGGNYGGTEANISSLGSLFNEMGEELKKNGLRSHYTGLLTQFNSQKYNVNENLEVAFLDSLSEPTDFMLVESFPAIHPSFQSVLGRLVPDYSKSCSFKGAKLIPLEFVFRFSCPPGSSFKERISKNPDLLGTLPLPLTEDKQLDLNATEWGFPVIECFSKLEPKDRFLSFSEALAYSGLSAEKFQEVLLKTAWIAGFIKNEWAQKDIQCADGKLEWGVSQSGEVYLVDHISIDELRLLKDDVQLSKEFLRSFYKKSLWYESLKASQQWSKDRGLTDWKSKMKELPPGLPEDWKSSASDLYKTLAQVLTGKFSEDAISLSALVSKIKDIQVQGEL